MIGNTWKQLVLLLLVLILTTSQLACKSRTRADDFIPESVHPALPGDLVMRRSVVLQTAKKAQGQTANIIISDHRNLAGRLQQRVQQQMLDHGFALSDQPSKADRLITIIVLHRGIGSRMEMERSVDAGYGAPISQMQGEDAVLVADLLMVRRRVPKSNAYLNNVSAHNTLSSNQIRLGFSSREHGILDDRALEEALATEITAIAAYGEDSQEHSQSSLKPARSSSGKSKKSVRKTKKKSSSKSVKKAASKKKNKR